MSSKITEVLLDNHTLNFQIFIVTNWKFDILLVFNTGPRPEC
jgi:hypothetical protein